MPEKNVPKHLEYTTEAREDIADAFMLLEEVRPGYGERFLARLTEIEQLIVQMPGVFARRDSGYHAAPLLPFRYLLVYEIEENMLRILSVPHMAQDHPHQ